METRQHSSLDASSKLSNTEQIPHRAQATSTSNGSAEWGGFGTGG